MMRVPKKVSLVAQVASILRAGLHEGVWEGRLPAERELASRLQISRPTLRLALQILTREGLIRCGRRKGYEIVCRSGPHPVAKETRSTVNIILWEAEGIQQSSNVAYLLHLQHWLYERGYEVRLFFQDYHRKNQLDALAALVESAPASCWLLARARPDVQEWFHARKLPAVILGSTPRHSGFPACDIDHYATCRHATHWLWSKGHRQITMLAPDSPLEGDKASERAFLEALAEFGPTADGSSLVSYEIAAQHTIDLQLERLLSSPSPPTALILNRSEAALNLWSYALRTGLRIPEDLSVLVRGDDNFLGHLRPRVSCYRVNWETFFKRLLRCIVQQVEVGFASTGNALMIPDFIEGETILRRK